MARLTGRTAVITGAGDGIGRAIALRFDEEGAAIIVAELSEESGERTAAEIRSQNGGRAAFLRTDAAEREQVEDAIAASVERFGSIDILVNNAWGGGSIARLENKTDTDMMHALALGPMAGLWAMRAAFPHMRERGWGRIISVCSLNGVNAHMYSADFNASKEALRALTRTAAREWAGHGITANIICPGAATTAYRKFAAANPVAAQTMEAQIPMGRSGDPEQDIAPVALFLASDDSRYMTGNTLFVDGGGHINGVNWNPSSLE